MEKTRRLIGDNIRKLETAKGKVIDDNTNLLEEGILDSISMMSIIEFLEELAQVEIYDDDFNIENFESINSIVLFVEKKRSEKIAILLGEFIISSDFSNMYL